mgnify:CR=1 FL=1
MSDPADAIPLRQVRRVLTDNGLEILTSELVPTNTRQAVHVQSLRAGVELGIGDPEMNFARIRMDRVVLRRAEALHLAKLLIAAAGEEGGDE